LVLTIWFVFALEIKYNLNFNGLGIYPRQIQGLLGIVLSPLIHANITHLYSNTFPLLILGCFLYYFYSNIATKILVLGVLLSGLLTWLIGRPSFHIGASGLIYVLFSFISFKGIIAKHYRLIALSLLVVFLYGSMIWYTIPIEKGISWEGHLSGFVIGAILALCYNKTIEKPKKYDWELSGYDAKDDAFMQQFNGDGYFFEIEKDPISDGEEDEINGHYFSSDNDYVYNYKPFKSLDKDL
jgi:membrane associated rhomboid family serine protease